jgi:hypothetical protein
MTSGDSLLAWDALGARSIGANHANLDVRNGIPVRGFDDTTAEAIFVSGVLPRHYSGGGLTVTLWWMGSTATVGDVCWETAIERGLTDLDVDSFAAGQATISPAPATSGVPTSTSIAHTAGAQMDDLVAGEPFRLRVTRITAGVTGNMAGDAELLAIELRETPATIAPPVPDTRSGMPYLLGFREPANSYAVMTQPGGKYDQIEAWLGRQLDLIPAFLGSDQFTKNWSSLVTNYVLGYSADPRGQLTGIYDRGAIPLFGMPIMISSLQRRYDLGAAGEFDEPHRAVYRRVAEIAQGRGLYLRLGWEVNEGYPWSWFEASVADDGIRLPDDPDWHRGAIPDNPKWRQLYIDTFRRLVDVARAEIPGVVVCWNHLRNTRRNVGTYFPGNSHVDVVTMDPYDNGVGGYAVDDASWATFRGTYANDSFTGPAGMVDWAAAHGLKVGFDEWGCWNKKQADGTFPTDHPTNNEFYCRKMFELFQRAVDLGIMSHQSYFQTGSSGIHQLWPETYWNINVRVAYLDLVRPGVSA